MNNFIRKVNAMTLDALVAEFKLIAQKRSVLSKTHRDIVVARTQHEVRIGNLTEKDFEAAEGGEQS